MSTRKYFDTSAIVKLYVAEPDTRAVQAELLTCDELIISRLTLLEQRAALYGKVRQRRLSMADATAALNVFAASLSAYTILPISEAVWQRAERLLDAHAVQNGLRPPDAIQIACALEEADVRPLDALVTTDLIQRAVAIANGLVVAP